MTIREGLSALLMGMAGGFLIAAIIGSFFDREISRTQALLSVACAALSMLLGGVP